MAELRWRHGKSASEMSDLVKQHLAKSDQLDKVKWDGDAFSASVGLGLALSVKGRITDDEIIIDKCGGIGGAIALAKIRETLQKAFPSGEIPSVTD